jgi:hypothetical protein
MEYDIVSAWTSEVLIGTLKRRIAKGWRPQGGVAVYQREPMSDKDTQLNVYVQAIVKGD